jgi:putative transposase
MALSHLSGCVNKGGGIVRLEPSIGMRIRLRAEEAGATYHVYGRGVDRRRIFVDEVDYQAYVDALENVVLRQGWHLLSFCLMPNHVHLLVETPQTNLGAGMQRLHSRHALAFNHRHKRTGHLFENRFKAAKVRTDERLVRLAGYIPANPVVARLCDRARDWPWGSDAMVAGSEPVPEWLAHAHLLDRLQQATSLHCYPELVMTAERGPC